MIYNGIAGVACTPGASRVVGLLGRVSPEKSQLEFVRAARIMAAKNPGVRFLIGGAPLFARTEYFEQVRAEAGPEVDFAGWTSPEDFLPRIALLVVPSAGVEAGPRVILEAFSAGVPVLASRAGGIPELIEHAVNGLLADSIAPEALAESICKALADPARLKRLANRARETWSERFTLDRFQSDVCDALEDTLAKSADTRARV